MAKLTIRKILDRLAELAPEAISRLCDKRDLSARGMDAKCEALARSYRGDYDELFADLLKSDLVKLLAETMTFEGSEHRLPRTSSYSKDDLIDFAREAFEQGRLPEKFEEVANDGDDGDDEYEYVEEEEEDDEDDEEGEEEEQVEEYDEEELADLYDELDYRGAEYERSFRKEIAYSRDNATQPLRGYQEEAVKSVMRALDPARPKLLHLATGGGKTRVANTIVAKRIEEHGGPVLWVTKGWQLLHQAACDFGKRNQGARMRRIGGDGHMLHPLPVDGPADVVYTTIQTLARRLDGGILKQLRPTLMVWDECHWGENASGKRAKAECKKVGIPLLGLTATPRTTSSYEVAYSKSFRQLVDEGFLAKPIVETPVKTGVRWAPQVRGEFKSVTKASLDELVSNKHRNERIVEHYVQNAARFGKTIVFACSIAHVDELAKRFERRGIAARPIHSEQERGETQQALDDFKSGAIDVLVNMEMLTHGVDVPDARSVFLCRPTTSDILFAQMIGRAARRDQASGKTSFFIVEFTDNVIQHANLFQTSQRFFTGSGLSEPSPRASEPDASSGAHVREDTFDPFGAPTWIPEDPDLPESIRGLWYRQGQSFEIELTLKLLDGTAVRPGAAWMRAAQRLADGFATVVPDAPRVFRDDWSRPDEVSAYWTVEPGSGGWRVRTRALRNVEGFVEAARAWPVLEAVARELGMGASLRTGTVVYLAWHADDELAELKNVLDMARLFEPAAASLVEPGRFVEVRHGRPVPHLPNPKCRPVASVFNELTIRSLRSVVDARSTAQVFGAERTSFSPIWRPDAERPDAVAVRLYGGTFLVDGILLWASLWQQILWAAARKTAPRVDDTSAITPTADLIALAREHLPVPQQVQQQKLLERLHARRCEMLNVWSETPELRHWADAARSWSAPS